MLSSADDPHPMVYQLLLQNQKSFLQDTVQQVVIISFLSYNNVHNIIEQLKHNIPYIFNTLHLPAEFEQKIQMHPKII